MLTSSRLSRLTLFILSTLLCACGGGGGGSDSDDNDGGGGGDGGGGQEQDVTLPSVEAFTTFDSGQVRPLALTSDGAQLLAVNTPGNCLAIIEVAANQLRERQCVPVGLEPVAVALRNDGEAWVVNHLSDSISIVNLENTPSTIKTLYVGDEPRDIIFAGPNNRRAFITTAHRGQNTGRSPQLFTPGVGRADVWVFDSMAVDNDSGLGATPETVLTLFTDTPRALARSADGRKVYAAGLFSGNRTTTARFDVIKTPPFDDAAGNPAPETAAILQFDGTDWVDDVGRSGDGNIIYNEQINFTVPDTDVFEIDAAADTPTIVRSFSGVGTTIFNLAVNPVDGTIYASNLEANNIRRFEGPGTRASAPTVQGHVVENRITVIREDEISPRHLNKHIDYDLAQGTDSEKARSLANPLEIVISEDGQDLYLAAFSSNKIARFATAELENDSFIPSENSHIPLTGGGPTGLVLDETRQRLLVMTRFDNAVALHDLNDGRELDKIHLFNPEPEAVVSGRPFLYDAQISSSRGDSSCSSCHIFGDLDALAWDLGNPDDVLVNNPNDFFVGPERPVFHPMKGPMSTQSLRGLKGNGPLHWRGDRTGTNALPGESLEAAAFKEFNGAFDALFARGALLSDEEMQKFTDFVMELRYPPNPIRNLDNSLTDDQAVGRDVFLNDLTTRGRLSCNDCHRLDPEQKLFGTSTQSTVEGPNNPQDFKIPHLRNMYQKVGFFSLFNGPQPRTVGFAHDGRVGSVVLFLRGAGFIFSSDEERVQVSQFMMAFDSDLAPAVGQQVTLDMRKTESHLDRLNLLIDRTATSPRECDVVFHGVIDNQARSGVFSPTDNTFQSDRATETFLLNELQDLSDQSGQAITFTCVPPGNGVQMGIDRDLNGVFNGDEN